MLKDALKTFINTFLNSKDDVQVFHGCNRCPHNNDNTSLGTDDNLSNRLAKLKNSAKAFIQYWACKFTSQTWHKNILNILPAGNGYQ